jgi:hypothetical protein
MLCFIIERMVICNQEAWDSLEGYIKVFDIRNYPGKNVPTACLKLKAIVNVLGDKLPSNSVRIILKGFAKASTSSFNQVCLTKIAMRSDSIYASLQDKLPLRNQVLAMLDDLKQKYQQLITSKKWEGVGHIGMAQDKFTFNASLGVNEEDFFGYAAYVKQAKLKWLLYEEWAKAQTCHHCGKPGHVHPTCKKYHEGVANGTNKPVPCTPKFVVHHGKFDRNPKLKALLSAFAVFATDCNDINEVIDDGEGDQIEDDENNAGDNEDLQAFLGMMGSLKE